MAKKPEYKTLKVRAETHVQLCALVEQISASGWDALGIACKEPPSISVVADEAVSALARLVKEKTK